MEKKQYLPFTRIIPNVVTISALVIGVSSIRFALDERWQISALCVFVALILDGIDGRIARALGVTSEFGAELDSLVDFVNFGVSPALIMYFWSLQNNNYKIFSWASVLFFIICMAIRLARFNLTFNKTDKYEDRFFIGVPAPMGALLVLMPLITDFELSNNLNIEFRSQTLFNNIYQIFVGCLLASRLPTFSAKNIGIKQEYIWFILLSFAIFIISITLHPWYVVPLIGIIYIISIPISLVVAKKIN